MIDKQGFAKTMECVQVKKLLNSPYFGCFDFVYREELHGQKPFILGVSVMWARVVIR